MAERCGWCARTHDPGPEHCLSGWVVVCGGRNYGDRERVFRVLDRLNERVEVLGLRHGACGIAASDPWRPERLRGADRWAHEWAAARGVPVQPFSADWDRYGKGAGPQRNQRMIEGWDDWQPSSRVVVCVAFPGGAGTADMVLRARAAGANTWVLGHSGASSEK